MQLVTFQTPRGATVTLTSDGHGKIAITLNGTDVENPANAVNGGFDMPALPKIGTAVFAKVGGKPAYLQVPADKVAALRDLKANLWHARPDAGRHTPTSYDIEDEDERVLNGGRR